MGGLYFWECKLKPDLPFIGCQCVIVIGILLVRYKFFCCSLHRLALHCGHDIYWHIWKSKVYIFIYQVALVLPEVPEVQHYISRPSQKSDPVRD